MSTETKGDVGTNVSLEPSVATEKIVEKSKGFIQDLIKKISESKIQIEKLVPVYVGEMLLEMKKMKIRFIKREAYKSKRKN